MIVYNRNLDYNIYLFILSVYLAYLSSIYSVPVKCSSECEL